MDYFLKLPEWPEKEGRGPFLLNCPCHTAAPMGGRQANAPAHFQGSLDTSDHLAQLKAALAVHLPHFPFSLRNYFRVSTDWICCSHDPAKDLLYVSLGEKRDVTIFSEPLVVRSIPDTQSVIMMKANLQEYQSFRSFSSVCSQASEIVWFSDQFQNLTTI